MILKAIPKMILKKNHQNDKGKSASINGRYGKGIENLNCDSKTKNKKMSNVLYVESGYSGHWEINE